MSATNGQNDDPRRGWLSGVAAYTQTVFEAKRFGETNNQPGTGEPKYGLTIIFVGPQLRERGRTAVMTALQAVIDDVYPSANKMPQRGLRGVKREPLIKKVADYPKMWPDCPDDEAVFVRVSSQQAPVLVDADGNLLTPEAAKHVIKPGCLVHVMFNAFHYTQGGDPGISLGLNAVKYARPGYKIGPGVSPQEAAAGPGDIDPDKLFADLSI